MELYCSEKCLEVPNMEKCKFKKKNIWNFKMNPKTFGGIDERESMQISSLSCDHQKVLKSLYMGLTEGEDTHSRSIFSQFHNAVNGILLELSVSIQKHIKQNNRAKQKPRIEMGKIAGSGPGILALLTAPLLVFCKWVATA